LAKERKYELQGKIGDGAVGLVRKALDVDSKRVVAVKFLAPDPKYIEVDAFSDVAERFRREGQRGAGLRHDNLVEVLAYKDNGEGSAFPNREVLNPFIVMEFVRGRTLESLIRRISAEGVRGPFINEGSLHIGLSVARALLHLHERKIVHRDVKPANIFIAGDDPHRGAVKLGDFGVTKWGDFLAAATIGSLTLTSQQGLGTFKYMSPEQAVRPKEVTVRSDMFSFGITLFELFSGRMLPSPHHVFEIMSARNMRGSITAKLMAVGLPHMSSFDEDLYGLVLDMFLQSPQSRPTSKQVSGRLAWALERLGGDADS
jgi:serine/threonine-protein kinase